MAKANIKSKVCPKCGKIYVCTTQYFHRDRSRRCGLDNVCITCSNKRRKSRKLKHRSPRAISRALENSRLIWDYKCINACECGEGRPQCLQFHHKDPETKKFGLSESKTRPVEEVQAEIDKCILLCGNCHLDLHFHEIVMKGYSK